MEIRKEIRDILKSFEKRLTKVEIVNTTFETLFDSLLYMEYHEDALKRCDVMVNLIWNRVKVLQVKIFKKIKQEFGKRITSEREFNKKQMDQLKNNLDDPHYEEFEHQEFEQKIVMLSQYDLKLKEADVMFKLLQNNPKLQKLVNNQQWNHGYFNFLELPIEFATEIE